MSLINKTYSLEYLSQQWFKSLFEFEMKNKTWFESQIDPRPSDYFMLGQFDYYQQQLIDEQYEGMGRYYLVIENKKRVVGRVNLYNWKDATAELGYRLDQEVTGLGLASRLVSELIDQTTELSLITAKVSHRNVASKRVLEKNQFKQVFQNDQYIQFARDL